MIQKTFIVGGEPKFASKFIERLNKRFGEELNLQIHAHKQWDQSGDRRENIPAGTDLVLVMKSNVNHSLRNWARKKASEASIKFIECCHKVAIAELDIRHCFKIVEGYNLFDQDDEPQDLYETWGDELEGKLFILPLWGMEDEGLFSGMDVYERMPWVHHGKRKMISKWDKIWVSASKKVSPEMSNMFNLVKALEGKKANLVPFYSANNGKSPYLKLIQTFKSFKRDTIGHSQVKLFADQWLRDAYLGTNFKDFTSKSNITYALNLIFSLTLNDISVEVKEIIDEHFPKPGRPRKVKETQVVESVVDSMIEEPVLVQELPPVLFEPEEATTEVIENYVQLGDLKIHLNDTTIILNEVHLTSGEINIKICGDIDVSIQRIEGNTLYGVEMKKKG